MDEEHICHSLSILVKASPGSIMKFFLPCLRKNWPCGPDQILSSMLEPIGKVSRYHFPKYWLAGLWWLSLYHSVSKCIWMTKWVTGWLLVTNTMHWWGMGTSPLCLVCNWRYGTYNSVPCTDQERILARENQRHNIGLTTLTTLFPVSVSLLLGVFFPKIYTQPLAQPMQWLKLSTGKESDE